MSRCDLDFTFDLAVVTLTFIKFFPDCISETVKCWKLIVGRNIAKGL